MTSDRSETKARDVLTEDDHARGCAGREYACTCGYDERVAAEIERLRAALRKIAASDARSTTGNGHARCIGIAREALPNG